MCSWGDSRYEHEVCAVLLTGEGEEKGSKRHKCAIISINFPVVLLLFMSLLQEMMDIVKAIYDMMGKYTYPVLKEDAPRQHVEVFFQVLEF